MNWVSKKNGALIDSAEDLYAVRPMYNLIEYSKDFRETTGSLRKYYRDEPGNDDIRNSKSFKHKTSITENIHQIKITRQQKLKFLYY